MNTYQEIVNSVQANILVPVTQLEEKNTLREKLDRELEEFFAKGGKPKVLAMGETEYRDGKVPVGRGNGKEKKKYTGVIQETPSELIVAKNKEIRKVKPKRVVVEKELVIDERIQALVKEQMAVLGELYSKFKYGDKSRFGLQCGISTATIDRARNGKKRISFERWELLKTFIENFKFSEKKEPKPSKKRTYKRSESPEALRRMKVIELRKDAEIKGLSVFQAPCKKHGWSDYYLHGKQPARCAKCRMDITKNHRELHKDAVQKDKDQRAKYNKDKVLEAVKDGKAIFTGLCVRCGYTDMKYSKTPNTIIGYTYRCLSCTRKAQIAYKERKNAKA